MQGRLLMLAAALLFAGCVAPGAQLSPSNVSAILDGIAIEGAQATLLPNGDRLLTLAGQTAGVESYELQVPEGLTYVEVELRKPTDGSFAVGLADKGSMVGVCRGVRYQAWYVPIEGPFRCGAVAAGAGGSTWAVRVARLPTGDPLEVPTPAAFEVAVTLSALPLDGPAAKLKLDQLTKPVFEALETTHHKVPAADGALLHVEVTLPDADAKAPTLLLASPYNSPERAAAGVANQPFIDYWTARGYAFATMDLRGTGISGGCFAMRGAIDQSDVKAVIDWLGTQEWSDGKVGMMGVSYEGFTPIAAAVAQPEHLVAVYAGAPAIDMYANYVPGGVNTGRTFSTGMVGYVVGNAADTTDDPSNPVAPVEYRADAVCDPLAITAGNDPRDIYSDYFAERNLSELADRIQVPVYLEQGFWDNNVKSNFVPDFFNALQVPKRGVFGSWEHNYAVRADQWIMLQAWFDHWLMGRDTGILDAPVVDVLTNTRMHRAATEWPARDATAVEVPIQGGQYVAAPAHAPIALPLPDRIETKSDPFPDGLYVTGVPTLAFKGSLQRGGSTYYHAELHEETADGKRQIVIMGWLNAAHLDGHRTYSPFAPGETRDHEMLFLPIDHVVQPGSRLVLVLRSTGVDDGYGGPEGGLTEPGVVAISDATLRLPTLPMETLQPAPRSAS